MPFGVWRQKQRKGRKMLRLYIEADRVFTAAKDRLKRQEGQAMVEYALILGLVSVLAIGVLSLMGVNIKDLFTKVNNSLIKANSAP